MELVISMREIGLLSDRVRASYDRVGLMKYFGGRAADQLSGDQMIAELDGETRGGIALAG